MPRIKPLDTSHRYSPVLFCDLHGLSLYGIGVYWCTGYIYIYIRGSEHSLLTCHTRRVHFVVIGGKIRKAVGN